MGGQCPSMDGRVTGWTVDPSSRIDSCYIKERTSTIVSHDGGKSVLSFCETSSRSLTFGTETLFFAGFILFYF